MLLRTMKCFSAFTISQKPAPEVHCKKRFLKDFANFTGKHQCWRFF